MKVADIRKTLRDRGRSDETIEALVWFVQHAPKGNRMYDSLYTIVADYITDPRIKLSDKQLGKIKSLHKVSQLHVGPQDAQIATDHVARIEALEASVLALTEAVEKRDDTIKTMKSLLLKLANKVL